VRILYALVVGLLWAHSSQAESAEAQPVESSVEYDVVFKADWTSATHPVDFPTNAHFSGLVGGLHNELITFWESGRTASQGIQRMAEFGGQSTLLSEVNATIAAGTSNRTLSGSGIGSGTGSAALRFRIDSSHPLVTLTSMIAPSPDWFVGVHGLPLLENGAWVSQKTVMLYPYDAGTDSGVTFRSPDQVTVPRGVITPIGTPPLGENGTAAPLGTFTFTRVAPATLGNISSRLQTLTDANVTIAGFIIQGSAPKKVMIRAVGPSLSQSGVSGALANPQLELHDADRSIATNDDWQTTQLGGLITSDQAAEIKVVDLL
jgi:hypothetical protein